MTLTIEYDPDKTYTEDENLEFLTNAVKVAAVAVAGLTEEAGVVNKRVMRELFTILTMELYDRMVAGAPFISPEELIERMEQVAKENE